MESNNDLIFVYIVRKIDIENNLVIWYSQNSDSLKDFDSVVVKDLNIFCGKGEDI